ncbi:Carbonic anhydrase 2 [Posidoniimonas corsicana]|uniref:carbonic anhydrase n=1 Tax=Posidoniimonas corsicana TaxID=1938618 RepID=A0A5C5VG08_9BACT|nr:carbonic anhydrase [Posidoniimonas corsicana]TWT36877.1 Carbonic anhydrase 2 [Posidoniimonas corsicana]
MAKKKAAQKSAAEALEALKAGNDRFVEEDFNDPKEDCSLRNIKRREELVGGQKPWAIVLCCADSRVPPEIAFDCGLGEIFTIRVAGNVANPESIASIEYAAIKKIGGIGANLIVVLGHESCGAVKAAIDNAAAPKPADLGPHINGLLSYLTPAVSKLSPKKVTEFNNASLSKRKKDSTLTEAVKANALNSVSELNTLSQKIPNEDGVVVVPAIYRLATGKVDFFEA